MAWVLPSRSTSTSRRADSALTTDAPDAVQTAGGRVGAAAELAAGVQAGHDDLDAGQAGARLDVDRDAAPVVADLDRAVGVQVDLDAGAVTAQGLVDGVVDDLPEAVHEPARVGGPDVHARPLADGLEPLEDQQVAGGVGIGLELAVTAGVQGLGHLKTRSIPTALADSGDRMAAPASDVRAPSVRLPAPTDAEGWRRAVVTHRVTHRRRTTIRSVRLTADQVIRHAVMCP